MRIASAVLLLLAFAGLARAAVPAPPGVVVYYSPPASGKFVGSPGLLVLSDGTYLAKCDQFGPNGDEHKAAVTRVFRSKDRGATWSPLATIDGLFWSTMFEHRGAVYQIGTRIEYGELLILKSTDGGKTWTSPKDANTGLLRTGQWHTAPVPVIEHAGRLWRAVEDAEGPGTAWGVRFNPHLMSIPVDGNLLDASQWTITPRVPRTDNGWLGGKFKVVLEGNAVLDHASGKVLNILRSEHPDLAAVATASADGRTLAPDPAFDAMPFEGTDKKFMIRWDEPSKRYYALTNKVAPHDAATEKTGDVRNTLALYESADLRTWTLKTVLLHHPDAAKHAFQYPDWVVDGDDLLVASRTGFDSPGGLPGRGHDANYLTFHRFKNFRNLTPADGVPLPTVAVTSRDFGGLRVSGTGFAFATLKDGAKAFTNRDYVWADVPAALRGATITQGDGNFRGAITVAAIDTPQTLRVLTALPTDGVDLTGFTAVPALRFVYTDRGRSGARVYEKQLKAGESIKLPSGNFAGVHVIVPASQH